MSVERVQVIFREIFDDPKLVIRPDMSAKDVATWDSFNHINLIVALEEAFNLTFTTEEVAGMTCVGDLVQTLQARGVQVSW